MFLCACGLVCKCVIVSPVTFLGTQNIILFNFHFVLVAFFLCCCPGSAGGRSLCVSKCVMLCIRIGHEKEGTFGI